ncbi:tyrosine-type recombinase/integrase [Kibdelosporangium philippinense]|uniref:Tyrosine-type recombinase/integrase n=1 Tax=Kibdelosporangium philippinense TaxID=211113 RepID=A0ABS8Z4V7_9PSEU|nr:tyrosine-type recombinase/integrase [Kibdelosporangium philippinense]MCE7002452.1 tyrosine-type recombinase/integrase [Kibdelosporangium philippinense]
MAHIEDMWFKEVSDPNRPNKTMRIKKDKHGKGMRYKVRWEVKGETGERTKSFPDGRLESAKKFKTKIEDSIYDNSYQDPDKGNINFHKYTESILNGRSQDESTQHTLRTQLRCQVYPFFTGAVGGINTSTIRDWLAWMTDRGLSDSYQRILFDHVSSILTAAVVEGMLKSNPCKDPSITGPQPARTDLVVWPESKLHRIELALPERHKIVVPLGSGLGLRGGEIFAFSREDIDRREMVYHCRRQMVTTGEGIRKFKLPKMHKTRRVPIGRGLLQVIDDYADQFPEVEMTLPWGERDKREYDTVKVLMTNKHGDLYTRQAFNNVVWKKAFADAGLAYITHDGNGMHAMRHLFACRMLQGGTTIKDVASMLGHADEAFTLKVYIHLGADRHDRARSIMDTVFVPRPTDGKEATVTQLSSGKAG